MEQSTNRMTDVQEFMSSLRAGVFEQKLAKALSDVAMGVIAHNKQGKVTLTFTMKQIAESNQVNCQHKIGFDMPTRNGKRTEEDVTDTPLHVNRGGRLTLFPEDQHQMFDNRGEVTTEKKGV